MDKPTISSLFTGAARLLRAEFEFIRSSNPHSAEKGEETEHVLETFLNAHLPRRFRATSGIVIDYTNSISRQQDVIVYDALSSPMYRAAEKTQILPIDTVAGIIEVKTSLNKGELRDSFEKVASCKQLEKRPLSKMDREATGSTFSTVGTLGVIFGFDSETSLESLAENVAELNAEFPSRLWPDVIVVLDKGVISYGIGYPGENRFAGQFGGVADEGFVIPPFYIHLLIHQDGAFSLNRFFLRLLSQLTFYPYRLMTPPFDVMLEGASKEAMTMAAYQFNRSRELRPVPPELYMERKPRPPLAMKVYAPDGQQIGLMEFMPWQDGSVIRWIGAVPLQELLSLLLPNPEGIVVDQPGQPGMQLSSVLGVTAEDFRIWPGALTEKSDLKAELLEVTSNGSDQPAVG